MKVHTNDFEFEGSPMEFMTFISAMKDLAQPVQEKECPLTKAITEGKISFDVDGFEVEDLVIVNTKALKGLGLILAIYEGERLPYLVQVGNIITRFKEEELKLVDIDELIENAESKIEKWHRDCHVYGSL